MSQNEINNLEINMQRYFLVLSYKGTNYNGWQIQPNGNTIQGEINNTLTKLNSGAEINCMGCGRTDTGVHASKFFAHFDFDPIFDLENFKYKMNIMLPNDIVIHKIFKVKNEAHSRFDALSRTYKYHISTTKNAFNFETSLLFQQKLDIQIMNQACIILKSYSNFESFSKVKTEVKTFDCHISEAFWVLKENEIIFTITANRFLRNMVRSIVGTMIDIGTQKLEVEDLNEIIISRSRSNAGKSVLANGLFLTDIKYTYL